MEKEEWSTKLTGRLLTLLFIYFYAIVHFMWDSAMELFAWGKASVIVQDFSEWIVPLVLEVFALVYGIIAVYQAMKHNRGSVAALRWSVVFMLVIAIERILNVRPDVKAFVGSAFKFVVFLYLLIFLIYLFRAKSIRRMFPKEDRKNTAIVWAARIIALAAFGWNGYRTLTEHVHASPFKEAGSVMGKTVIIDYATLEIPDGWRVDTIIKVQNLQMDSIISDRKWLVFQSQLGAEEDIREHLLNSVMTLGADDDDFVSQDGTVPISINGGNAYISRFTKKEGKDTVKCAFASVFDPQTKRNATLMLMSDSVTSDNELRLLMERVSFTYPILENK